MTTLAEIFTQVNNLIKKTMGRQGRTYLGSDEFQKDLGIILNGMKNNHRVLISTNDIKIQLQTLKSQTWLKEENNEEVVCWNHTNKQLLEQLEQLQ